jgi:uncharacterized protein YndB with AHSA1/START domain
MAIDSSTLIPTIDLHRSFDVPVSKVYEAWASSDAIKNWFGPVGCTVISAEWEPATGQPFRIAVNSDEMGEMAAVGTFLEVDPDKKMVLSWNWEGDPAENESRLTLIFSQSGEKSVLRLVHDGFIQKDSRDHHEIGWNGTLDKFAALLEN